MIDSTTPEAQACVFSGLHCVFMCVEYRPEQGQHDLLCMLGVRENIKRQTWSWHAGPEPLAGEAQGPFVVLVSTS